MWTKLAKRSLEEWHDIAGWRRGQKDILTIRQEVDIAKTNERHACAKST